MELKDYIEAGIEKLGNSVSLAKHLGQDPTVIRNAKGHRRGLPNYACVVLADLLGVERIEVIAASELVTEKNPERREVWLPFVRMAEARRLAAIASQGNAKAETTTAPEREPSELVASRGIEPRTRGFSIFVARLRDNSQILVEGLRVVQVMGGTEMRVLPDHADRFPAPHLLHRVERHAFLN